MALGVQEIAKLLFHRDADKKACLKEVVALTKQAQERNRAISKALQSCLGGALVNIGEFPDHYGFFYGELEHEGNFHRLDILPPLGIWSGGEMLESFTPHKEQWIAFIDGEEVARATAPNSFLLEDLQRV